MFHTDIGTEFARMVPAAGWDRERVRGICLTAVDAAWVDDSERRELRERVTSGLDALDGESAA
jgi:adenosine deaminase